MKQKFKHDHLICVSILFFLFFPLLRAAQTAPRNLRVNLFCFSNGVGLQTDKEVLQEALQRLGCSVECIEYGMKPKKCKADINIFFEHPLSDKFSFAERNWLIPNPEWYTQDLSLLKKIDLILCKTRESERIFRKMGLSVYYLGFTSPDCRLEGIEKDFGRFFHLGGRSDQKGTSALLKLWMSKLDYPHLTIVKHRMEWMVCRRNIQSISQYVPKADLRMIQNQCGIHLCLSETEGFGHYMMEAMSAGCIVLTTNAPPMNEFISDQRCLIPFDRTSPQRLGINYYVDTSALKNQIDSLLQLSKEELRLIGEHNRAIYERKTSEFYERLDCLMDVNKIISHKTP